MPVIRYVIEVTYPPNLKEDDLDAHIGELIDTMSKYGLGVSGWIESVDSESDN